MSTKLENVEKNVVKLTVTVPAEKFDEAMTKSFRKNVKNITLPGFRKGKAPRKMVEKYYGESVFYEDAIDFCAPEAYDAAITETKIEPVGKPEMDVSEIGSGKDMIFTITVTVKPEAQIDGYKGISVDKIENKVTAKEINAELKSMQEKGARLVDVSDRAAKLGDTVIMDFEGSVDGVNFDGGTAKDFSYELGSNQFIPGFEEQLIGKKIDEDIDVNVSFPEDYHSEELKGKPALFKVKIHSIKAKEVPALDDEFAKDVSEFNTLEELKADVKAKLTTEAENKTKIEKENAVLDVVSDLVEVDVPQCMVDTQIDNMMRDYSARFSQQGLSIEQFMQYTGQTMESFREQFAPQAMKQVRINLALEKIAELENIEVSDDEVDAELAKAADLYKMELEKLKEVITPVETENIRKDLKVSKAVELVVSASKVKASAKAKKADDQEDAKEKAEKPKRTVKAKAKKEEDK